MNSKINVELYAFSGGFDRWKGACGYGMGKRSSENRDERVSLKNRISRFSDDLVLTCKPAPLPSGGRGLGRGWLLGLHEFDFA